MQKNRGGWGRKVLWGMLAALLIGTATTDLQAHGGYDYGYYGGYRSYGYGGNWGGYRGYHAPVYRPNVWNGLPYYQGYGIRPYGGYGGYQRPYCGYGYRY